VDLTGSDAVSDPATDAADEPVFDPPLEIVARYRAIRFLSSPSPKGTRKVRAGVRAAMAATTISL